MRNHYRPECEALEDRLTPAYMTWPNPEHLTVSFAPDGTQAEDAGSTLFKTLDKTGSTREWQLALLRAAQAWASYTNVNLGLVADSGQALGTQGSVQGDDRFGDIRFSAKPLASSALATGTHFSWTGTTWAGDIVLNDQAGYTQSGATGHDLYSIAIHETGHALGLLDNYQDPGSVMYYRYAGARSGLGASDIAAIRGLYGLRSPDRFDAARGNEAIATASAQSDYAWAGDISTPSDVDTYKVSAPSMFGITGMSVKLKTAGLSLLAPNITLYDEQGNPLGRAAARTTLDGDLEIQISNVRAGHSYYIRVAANTSDVFGVGAYQVQVAYRTVLGTLTGQIVSPFAGTIGNLNNTISSATQLLPLSAPQDDERFDYYYEGGLVDSADQDFLQIKTPMTSDGAPVAAHVLSWGKVPSGVQPIVHVFNASQDRVPLEVVGNMDGVYSIQLSSLAAGQFYYIQVAPLERGTRDRGSYSLGIKFDNASGLVKADAIDKSVATCSPAETKTLDIPQNALFHFVLGARAAAGNPDGVLTLKISDQQGRVVFQLDSKTGMPPKTGTVYLITGKYRVSYGVRAINGGAAPAIEYWLKGSRLSDPIGPYQSDSTASPSGSSSSSGGSGYAYDGGGSASGYSEPVYY